MCRRRRNKRERIIHHHYHYPDGSEKVIIERDTKNIFEIIISWLFPIGLPSPTKRLEKPK